MLPRNLRMEALCRGYIQIIAGQCGMTCTSRLSDFGIDQTIHDIHKEGRRISESGFLIDVQAKSTMIAHLTATEVVYDLPVMNYEDLRQDNPGTPRILVVLVLPQDELSWVTQTEQQLQVHSGAYWLSLRGWQPSTNRKSVRVRIPRVNLFSRDALCEMMNKARRRLPL